MVRLLQHVDVSKEEEKNRITNVLEKVMKNHVLRVLVDITPEEESEVEAFIQTLRARPHMHFVDVKA